jgi:hypothetical protein
VRTLVNVARTLGHVVPGVAYVHIPPDALVGPTPIHVQGIPRAPAIRAVPAGTKGTIARLGGTGAQAQTGCRDAASQHGAGNDPLHYAIGIHAVLPHSGAASMGCLNRIVRLAADENMGHLTHIVPGPLCHPPADRGSTVRSLIPSALLSTPEDVDV